MGTTRSTPECTRCGMSLYRRNDPVYTGTVLAVGSHRCREAQKVVAQAAAASKMFASTPDFVHVRYISPILTVRAWTSFLQTWTTTHALAHKVLPLPAEASFVVSYPADQEPDMPQLYAQLSAQIAAVGTGKAPERIIGSWQDDQLNVVLTHSADTTIP